VGVERILSALLEVGGISMIAYTYPLLSIFWTICIFFFVGAVFFTIIWAFIDNFRRKDHHGWAKALWALIIIVFPFLGTLIYLIARPATVE
jgi:hypothetical protein